MKRWAIFISGRGSNLQALSEVSHEIDISLCVTSQLKVPGVLRSRRLGIPILKIDTKLGEVEWQRIHQELVKRKINRIFLLGFMRILPKSFVDRWQGRIFNLHPSLLPLHPGKDAIEKSFAKGDPLGVTVHHVIAEMDAGKAILQKKAGSPASSIEQAQFFISRLEQNLVRLAAAWN